MVISIKIGLFMSPWGSVGVRGGPWGSAAPANHLLANIFTFVSLILCFVSFWAYFFYQITVSHGVFNKNRSFYESVGVRGGPWGSVGVRGSCKSRVCEYFHIYVSYFVFSVILSVFFLSNCSFSWCFQ